jgi:hypothetical protein
MEIEFCFAVMPRKLKLEYPGAIHPVLSRGAPRESGVKEDISQSWNHGRELARAGDDDGATPTTLAG